VIDPNVQKLIHTLLALGPNATQEQMDEAAAKHYTECGMDKYIEQAAMVTGMPEFCRASDAINKFRSRAVKSSRKKCRKKRS